MLIFSMFAYIGLILIFLAFEKYIARKKFFFFVLIFLPSIGFWGSGLIITENVKKPLANELLFGDLQHGGHVVIKEEDGKITFDVEAKVPA